MKPFLGVNITEDKKNQFMDGTELMVATVSEVQKTPLIRPAGSFWNTQKRQNSPCPSGF